MIILMFLIGVAPSVGIFLWLRGGVKTDEYKTLCSQALRDGVLCSFAIVLLSMAFNILELVIFRDNHPVLQAVAHPFITLAFSEELIKFLTMKRFRTKHPYAYSWLDITVLMTIIGMGFGIMENFPIALGSGPIVMLVRAITIGHGGYGFLMGYFMGKAEKTGKNVYRWIGFVLPWLLHGAYDCGLSQTLYDLNDNIAFLSISLALLSVITMIVAVVFFARARKNEKYTLPLHGV